MTGHGAGGFGELADLDEALRDGARGGAFAVGGPRRGDGGGVDGKLGMGLEQLEEQLRVMVLGRGLRSWLRTSETHHLVVVGGPLDRHDC